VLDRVLTDRKSEWAVGSEALIPICNTQITEMEIEQENRNGMEEM